jgi:hypothetical protein
MLLPKVPLDEINADWNDIKQAFKNEFAGGDENWKNVLQACRT